MEIRHNNIRIELFTKNLLGKAIAKLHWLFCIFRCIIVKIRKIESGLYAASGKGQQSPIVISVTNKELRDKLSRMNCKIGGWKEGFDPFFNAPVVLVVLAPKDWANKIYDGSLVMGNMMLAAHALNIGSCWINRAKQEFETEEGNEILKSLGIEGEYEGIGHCILGYVDGEYPSVPARKPNRVYYVE